jgi:EncFtn-like ferroxidase
MFSHLAARTIVVRSNVEREPAWRRVSVCPNGPSIYISPIVSLIEELDAIDWYRRRADDIAEETLKELLPHNMREEMEHAWMLLEWIRAARQRL